jgi:hypothetical protein
MTKIKKTDKTMVDEILLQKTKDWATQSPPKIPDRKKNVLLP